MVGSKISSKYTDDHYRVSYLVHKVCDGCATINQKKNEFCIKCGYDKFTPMSKTEAILLSIHPSDRDNLGNLDDLNKCCIVRNE